MMSKGFVFAFILSFFIIGCSNNDEKLTRVEFQQLYSENSYKEPLMILDQHTLEELTAIFNQIKWEQQIKAEMAREEDLKATLFVEKNKNLPEQLIEYLIWFNADGSATIINRMDHELGSLENKESAKLEKIVGRD
jgi:uncharacterized protein YcfL